MKLLLLLTLFALPLAASVPAAETADYPNGWSDAPAQVTYDIADIEVEPTADFRFDVDRGYLPVLVTKAMSECPAVVRLVAVNPVPPARIAADYRRFVRIELLLATPGYGRCLHPPFGFD